MIEQELLLLGLLKESPKHGYEIKKKAKEVLSLFAGGELKSIYYPLGVLKRKGLVIEHVGKLGKRPQRFTYKLTSKGESRFHELLTKSLLDFKRPQFSLDLSLYFLNYMDPEVAQRRLRARMLVLKKLSKDLSRVISSLKNKKPASLTQILEHDLRMIDTESKFLSTLIKK